MFAFKHFCHGVIYPAEFVMLRSIYDEISSQPWFAAGTEARDEFARFMLTTYRRGMVDPEKLQQFCMTAAKRKFSCRHSAGRPPLPRNPPHGSSTPWLHEDFAAGASGTGSDR